MSTLAESKHTPGPWKVMKRGNQTGLRTAVVTDKDNRPVTWFDNPSELQLANASLIAAAPAMLEALELLMSRVPGDWKEMAPVSKAIGVYLTGKQLESFEAAIKLAKGESHV